MEKKVVSINSHSGFDKFCKQCFKTMNADKRNEIIASSVTGEMKKVLDDSVLADTIKTFFENNLNLSETSRKSFIHRNTLVYRLDKIHSLTGLDPRNFEDAVSLRLYMWLREYK